MQQKQASPLIASFAAIAATAPPLLIGAAVCAGLVWMLSDAKEDSRPVAAKSSHPEPASEEAAVAPSQPSPPRKPALRRIQREDLAQALAHGARRMTRQEAVAGLEALGFKKTAAYRALSTDGRFKELLAVTPDGLLAWTAD